MACIQIKQRFGHCSNSKIYKDLVIVKDEIVLKYVSSAGGDWYEHA